MFRPLPPEPTDGLWELQDDEEEDDESIGDVDEIPKIEKVENDLSCDFNINNETLLEDDEGSDSKHSFLKHRCGKDRHRTVEEIETVL